MACQYCFSIGKTDQNWDTASNILYINNSGCSAPAAANFCNDNANRVGGCTACTGCAYTGTNGAGVVSCYTNSGCTISCSSVDEFGGGGVLSALGAHWAIACVWGVAVLFVAFFGLHTLKKRSQRSSS